MASVIHYAAANQREQHRLLADADKIAKKFRIPEKRVWHIKVKAFADSKQWSNLRLLADSKKSPIGKFRARHNFFCQQSFAILNFKTIV